MKIIAGVDEVGRGSLIGPVYAAAVILNKSIDKKIGTPNVEVHWNLKLTTISKKNLQKTSWKFENVNMIYLHSLWSLSTSTLSSNTFVI